MALLFLACTIMEKSMTVASNNTLPKIIKNSFQTIEEYSSALSGLDLQGSQLSTGSFNGRSEIVAAEKFQLGIRQADAQHVQDAKIGNGKIGLIFPLVKDEYINNGKNLGPDKQYIIFNGDENRIIFPEKHKHISLMIDINDLQKYLSEDETNILIDTFRDMSSGIVSPDLKLLLTQKLYSLFETLKQTVKIPENSHLVFQDSCDSLFYALNSYRDAYAPKTIEKVKNNERLLSRALDYIHSEPLQTLSVSNIVTNIHASSRSIQYCFSELLDMSPKKYLVKLRLNAIRRELYTSSPNDKTITTIANKYGVINIGRFKQDYEKLFNETPRDTLSKI